jgi:sialic acid synthase SpsE
LGKKDYKLTKKALAARVFARSLFVVRDIKKGEFFTEDNVRSIRPGFGLAPQYLSKVLKERSKRDIAKGTPLSQDLIM